VVGVIIGPVRAGVLEDVILILFALALPGSAFGGGGRELPNWEVIAIGGLAGAIAAIATTPADVVKTRIMTAAANESISAGTLLVRCCSSTLKTHCL
jgi:hypothetical protein